MLRAVVCALNGQAPARTLVFATWDAEEWGMLGSTEYVEDDSLRLRSLRRLYSQTHLLKLPFAAAI